MRLMRARRAAQGELTARKNQSGKINQDDAQRVRMGARHGDRIYARATYRTRATGRPAGRNPHRRERRAQSERLRELLAMGERERRSNLPRSARSSAKFRCLSRATRLCASSRGCRPAPTPLPCFTTKTETANSIARFGYPLEGYGFTNNVYPTLRAPSFDQCKVSIRGQGRAHAFGRYDLSLINSCASSCRRSRTTAWAVKA